MRRAVVLIALLAAACGPASPSGQATPQASPSITPTLAPSPGPSPTPTSNVMDIPMDYQDHPLSCEAAALKMALSKEGIQIGEDDLLALMGRDDRPAELDSNRRLVRWGNPNLAFVGDPDGKLTSYTGYGVYAGPVAKAATTAGGKVLAWGTNLPPGGGDGISPAAVYQALLGGHPVVAWISNTYHDVQLSSYAAFDGTIVRYTLTEHAVTLIGVRPDAVLVNDPWFGQAWHSKVEFESAFHTFFEMAVILE